MELIRFETLGCKLNQIETESLAHAFTAEGYRVVGAEQADTSDGGNETSDTADLPVTGTGPAVLSFKTVEHPELCVVNTCTVTGKAEQKARRLIRSLLTRHPQAPVLVTGCYAEVEADAIAAISDRVCVFPGSRKGELAALPRWIAEYYLLHPEAPMLDAVTAFCSQPVGSGRPIGTPGLAETPASGSVPNLAAQSTFALATDDFLFHSRASIKIQDGCNNHCTYCRIRLARGKAVSLSGDDVIAQIQRIEDAGWREVVLTGVNLSQYRDADGDFADLLSRILRETGSVAIRISSLYPERVNEAILEALANDRVRPHFHLSIQSGSERILRAMKRPYTAETVYQAVERLRTIKDNPFIACDIITGFPGETDEDFEATYTMCETLAFAGIHAFPFSARPGTEAWSMKPKIPERIAGERVARLTELARRNHEAYEGLWNGKTLRAIVERGLEDGMERALTENYLSVLIPATGLNPGTEIQVLFSGPGRAEPIL